MSKLELEDTGLSRKESSMFKRFVQLFLIGFCISTIIINLHGFDNGTDANIYIICQEIGAFAGALTICLIIAGIYRLSSKVKPQFSSILIWALVLWVSQLYNNFLKENSAIFLLYVGTGAIAMVFFYYIFLKFFQKYPAIILGLTISCFLSVTFLVRAYAAPDVALQNLSRAIKRDRVLGVVSKDFPKKHELLLEQIAKEFPNGKWTQQDLVNQSVLLLHQVLYYYLQKAESDILYKYITVTIEQFEYLLTINPNLVLKMTNPKKYGFISLSFANNIPKKYITLPEKIAIMESPPKFNTEEQQMEAEQHLVQILGNLYYEFGEDSVNAALSLEERQPIEDAMSAAIVIAYLKEIKKLGVEKSAVVLRYIASAEANEIGLNASKKG